MGVLFFSLIFFDNQEFLSCLCGSEHGADLVGVEHIFLSCLCGSELCFGWFDDSQWFLSCLCGSER